MCWIIPLSYSIHSYYYLMPFFAGLNPAISSWRPDLTSPTAVALWFLHTCYKYVFNNILVIHTNTNLFGDIFFYRHNRKHILIFLFSEFYWTAGISEQSERRCQSSAIQQLRDPRCRWFCPMLQAFIIVTLSVQVAIIHWRFWRLGTSASSYNILAIQGLKFL